MDWIGIFKYRVRGKWTTSEVLSHLPLSYRECMALQFILNKSKTYSSDSPKQTNCYIRIRPINASMVVETRLKNPCASLDDIARIVAHKTHRKRVTRERIRQILKRDGAPTKASSLCSENTCRTHTVPLQ